MRWALAASLLFHAAVVSAWALWPRPPSSGVAPLVVELVPVSPPPAPAPAPPAARPVAKAAPLRHEGRRLPPSPAAPATLAPVPSPSGRAVADDMGTPATSGAAAGGPTRDALYHLGAAATPLPDYPWSARRRGREGRVVVDVEVDAQGRPVRVSVRESSGDAALDRAALDALAAWTLVPAVKDGVAVASRLSVPIRFELRGATDLAAR